MYVNLCDDVKNVDFIHVYICEATDSMQYHTPNANLDSDCQTVSIVTGDNGCRHLSVRSLLADFVAHGALSCLFLRSYLCLLSTCIMVVIYVQILC